MAVLQLSPRDETFERVRSLTGIARLILDIRLVLGLLTAIWLFLRDQQTLLVFTCVGMGWLLFVLLRWSTVGWIVCTHPAILAIDGALCFAVLFTTEPLSPVLLLAGTGALFTGLCLDRTGALYFSPLYAAGWWLVYSSAPPDTAAAPEIFFQIVVVPALLIGSLFLGAGIRHVVLQAAATERALREEMRIVGVSEERARIAREMHDSLIKSLHGLSMLAAAVPGWIDRDPAKGREKARQLAEMIGQAGKESREVVLAMRRADARASTTDLVEQVVDRWRRTSGRPAACTVVGRPELPAESALEMSAILGEALENVRRHTAADSDGVAVLLREEPGWVVLTITDEGGGIEETEGDDDEIHFGLIGMRERAARVGGRLTISSQAGVGTEVEVHVPAALNEAGEPLESASSGGKR